MSDSEAGSNAEKKKDPNAKPWYKLKQHPVIYILFLLNFIEFCAWWGCMCSGYWKVGPFTSTMQDPTKWFGKNVVMGPWFTCYTTYTYEPYAVWESDTDVKEMQDRFEGKTKCSGSLEFKKYKEHQVKAMVGFGGGILIASIISLICWILWIIFDIMSGLIRRMVLPILKVAQLFCVLIMMICFELVTTASAQKLWGYYTCLFLMFYETLCIVLHWLLSCCADKLECFLCKCLPCCICCPEAEDVS